MCDSSITGMFVNTIRLYGISEHVDTKRLFGIDTSFGYGKVSYK